MTLLSPRVVSKLQEFTACDVSDALLKLKVPGAGFIADLNQYSPVAGATQAPTIAPVSTVLFVAKGDTPTMPAQNIPNGVHWSDLTVPNSFVVLKQAPNQTNAVCGGIMALRMRARGVRGIVVAGRVRDLAELRSTNLPILAYGTSTVGAGAGSTPWAVDVSLDINGTIVKPGDIVFHDPANGLVIIPHDKVTEVLDLMPKLTAADERVKEDVLKGASVQEAFRAHRGG
ncbi:hypothetical protein HIM_10183 [Hirsutella minnesotensis 3608]|uniref:DlpA domain-containing protein n=1 Tax=Hirsutella minnesotensis 3608 TaxID=1043627 RepID=A0A0F7ZKC4_9HYPO|nr:hypothetical protein HIM_10183 [Hirsutella minnesotensis 3608]